MLLQHSGGTSQNRELLAVTATSGLRDRLQAKAIAPLDRQVHRVTAAMPGDGQLVSLSLNVQLVYRAVLANSTFAAGTATLSKSQHSVFAETQQFFVKQRYQV